VCTCACYQPNQRKHQMNFTQLKTVILSQFARTNSVAYLVLGKPGGGKSALCREVVAAMGGTEANTIEFNASTRDPVDVLGTPNNRGEYTQWVPPLEFWKLRRGVGKCFLILEELTDGPIPMQNALCRVIQDRYAGSLALSDELYIDASGNRTEDNSGANRLTTKLGNRMRVHTFEESVPAWVKWALDNNIDPVLIQFIRYRPKALSDFDPNRPNGINPTPRSWASVSLIDPALPPDLFFAECAGSVGEAYAAEYVAFRKLYSELVSFEDVVLNPTGTPVPEKLDVQYALVGSLSHNVTPGNVDRVAKYVDRMAKDFANMFWLDASRKNTKLKATKPWITWAASNANALMGA